MTSAGKHRTSLGGISLDEARRRLIFSLDFPTLDDAKATIDKVQSSVGGLKVGLELFVREGPAAVKFARSLGLDVVLDLKLHDIPETVGRAVASAAELGVRYLTLHAAGGRSMLERAVTEAERRKGPTLLAVTLLSSLDDSDLVAQGVTEPGEDHALRLAKLANDVGVRGFITSPLDVGTIRDALGPDVLIATPGIRPFTGEGERTPNDDQKRVGSAMEAVAKGADLLIVGRPIRDSAEPAVAARAILHEIARALSAL